MEMFGAVNSATFHLSRGGTESEEEIVGETGDEGMMPFTLTPANEGRLRCKSGDETSDWVPLAGIYTSTDTCVCIARLAVFHLSKCAL